MIIQVGNGTIAFVPYQSCSSRPLVGGVHTYTLGKVTVPLLLFGRVKPGLDKIQDSQVGRITPFLTDEALFILLPFLALKRKTQQARI